MDYLVGCTGFVGSNLIVQHCFDGAFHSVDITKAFDKRPDLLVYAGVRAEMFLANKDPEADRRHIENAIYNIQRICPKECILISTIAVYPDAHGVDEDTEIDPNDLSAYGTNRLLLELWVENNIENSLILRLPAIYGKGLKKNFLYDYIHKIPTMLFEKKFEELAEKEPLLREAYFDQGNGFWKCRLCTSAEESQLKTLFDRLGFSALHFTDSRSVYQFYSLAHLWEHIEIARKQGICKLNMATPPVSVDTVFRRLTGTSFVNELKKAPYSYDMRSKHAALYGGVDGYLISEEQELEDITKFVKSEGGVCV